LFRNVRAGDQFTISEQRFYLVASRGENCILRVEDSIPIKSGVGIPEINRKKD
jgi:hypothetical protein